MYPHYDAYAGLRSISHGNISFPQLSSVHYAGERHAADLDLHNLQQSYSTPSSQLSRRMDQHDISDISTTYKQVLDSNIHYREDANAVCHSQVHVLKTPAVNHVDSSEWSYTYG